MVLTEEQQMIRDMARDFTQQKIAPEAPRWSEQKKIPDEVLREMGELGFMGMTVPEEWGGVGSDYVSYALALEEIAAGDGAISTIMSVNNAPVCAAILKHGSETQKKEFLVPLARGEMIGAFGLSEAQAGSDAAALRTTARKEADDYIVNGSKQFISSAQIAGVTLIFALTDSTAGKKGITAFLVPTDTAGFEVTKVEEKMGQMASDTCALGFTDMRIPETCRLGAEGDGYRIALENLEQGRIGIAAQSVGMARAAFDFATQYARERKTFGKPIIEHQAVGFRLADMATKLSAARALVLSAAALRDAGQRCLKEASMAKLFASEIAEEVCSVAIQTLGGYGYLSEYPVERIARDVRVCQIYEGTSDIQRLVILREIIQS